ncbi:MAG: hypothetical protein AAFR61_23135 [Bacteroidota bacterium]
MMKFFSLKRFRLLALITLTMSCAQVQAQKRAEKKAEKKAEKAEKKAEKAQRRPIVFNDGKINVAYFGGHLVHPGVSVRYEKALKAWPSKRRPEKRHKQWLISGQAATFVHPHQNAYAIATAGILYRKTGAKGWRKEVGLDLGLIRSTHLQATLGVDEGEIYQRTLAGQWGNWSALYLGLGRIQYLRKKTMVTAWHARFYLAAQTPYNHAYSLHPMLSLGIDLPQPVARP